jgi:tetratricopeptide (TPR) repeat protein
MSIIHEALKKAERERQPRPRGVLLYGSVRTARRRWQWRVTAGGLIGLMMAVTICTWLWLQSPGEPLSVGTATPMPQHLPAIVWDGEAQADQHAAIAPPMPITQFFEAPRQSKSAEVPSPTPPVPLVLAAQTTAETAFERAREAEFTGQWEVAIRHYRQALTLNPTLVEARNNLGALYVRQQQLTAAISEFQAAVRLAPNYAMVRNNLGSAYFLIGEEALAIQEFLAALHIDGAYVSPLYNLASLYARHGDVGQAVAFLTRALAIEPAVWSWAQEDADFDGIKASPEFQRLRTQSHVKR